MQLFSPLSEFPQSSRLTAQVGPGALTLYTLEKKPLPTSSALKLSQNSSLRTAVRSLCQRSMRQQVSEDSP